VATSNRAVTRAAELDEIMEFLLPRISSILLIGGYYSCPE
jgi:hypothetical protein